MARRSDINKMSRKDLAIKIVKNQMNYGMKFNNPNAVVKGMLKGAGASKPQTKDSLIAGYYATKNPNNTFKSKGGFMYGGNNKENWRKK